ncbi:hypothetical protein [Amycolatopsis plumensis]|uniref:Uncharacterized protein n=1 Tax=Amycolatopsis plumensis TaxID=236508 RepID=A0ABV5U5I5_9PSEU
MSCEKATARYRITPPPCPVDDLRFDLQPRLSFMFTAEKSCVDAYLKQYGLAVASLAARLLRLATAV